MAGARKERVERRPQARRESGERKLWALLSPFSSLLLYFWPSAAKNRGDWRFSFPIDLTGQGIFWTALAQSLEFSAEQFFELGQSGLGA